MDKIDKLLDVIDHPERYSDDEIEAMLADPEAVEVCELLNKTKASLTSIPTPDVDTEWKEFKRSHRKRSFNILNLFSRNVAASIALGIASLAAIAAVVSVSVNLTIDKKDKARGNETAIIAEKEATLSDSVEVSVETYAIAPETIVFDNETFETIMDCIAAYYGYRAEFTADSPKSLRLYFRWNQAQTLDEVVESLNNFEQLHITVNGKTIKID